MTRRIRLAISTCPNDTFAFHGLLKRKVDWGQYEFQVSLLDIQQLNEGLLSKQFDVAKASFAAAVPVAEQFWVLPSGSALGFGVGPLLLASKENLRPSDPSQLTLCPGEQTTASMLFRMFYGDTTRVENCVFSEIMPRLVDGNADFGVCIHEGRFTWQSMGLGLVEDLGERWERETDLPLPLGGIFADRSLPDDWLKDCQNIIAASLDYGERNPQEALLTMREYAQEFDDDVLMHHVKLYVNEWTRDLQRSGADALAQFSMRCSALQPNSKQVRPLEVLQV